MCVICTASRVAYVLLRPLFSIETTFVKRYPIILKDSPLRGRKKSARRNGVVVTVGAGKGQKGALDLGSGTRIGDVESLRTGYGSELEGPHVCVSIFLVFVVGSKGNVEGVEEKYKQFLYCIVVGF
jgi:hypothetical protein